MFIQSGRKPEKFRCVKYSFLNYFFHNFKLILIDYINVLTDIINYSISRESSNQSTTSLTRRPLIDTICLLCAHAACLLYISHHSL